MQPTYRKLAATLMLCAGVAAGAPAVAQSYPAKPITIIVPFSPGGGVDTMGRLLAEKLRVVLDQNVIVENKPGASGMLGAQTVARAAPDGYTIMLGSAGETAINAYVYKEKMNYKPEDLVPVSLVARVPNVLIVGPSVKATNVAELVAHARANPGKVTYASSGVGNPQHLNGELLGILADVEMVHVPYRGASGQLADVAGGNVDMTFVSYAAALPFIETGKVKALAVTSKERPGFAKNIPAIAETQGLESYSLSNWFGVFAPKGTPGPVVDALNKAIGESLQDPSLKERLVAQGGEIDIMTAQQFADFVKEESQQYKTIVEKAGIVAE